MSEIAVDSIISDISLLLQNRTDELRLQLCDKIPTHEEKINEVFNSPQLPFCGLETKYLRHRYFVNTLKLQSELHGILTYINIDFSSFVITKVQN
uniref:Uncharacterized protein n=1 Tax=Amphimedon queenslandica TaxID=400682 RepID=A0A1X7T5J7_AMPQE